MRRILIGKAEKPSWFSFAFKNISFFEIIITKFIFTSKCIKAIEIILPLATRLIIYIFHILFFVWMLPLLFLHLLLFLPSSKLGNVTDYIVVFIGAFLILLYDEGKSYLIHVPSIIYIIWKIPQRTNVFGLESDNFLLWSPVSHYDFRILGKE